MNTFTLNSQSHRISSATAIPLLLALLVLVGAQSSQAAITHDFESSFPSTGVGTPAGLAIDDASGSVYVLGKSSGTLAKFEADGTPAAFSALGAHTISLPCGASCNQIAIDNSGSQNQGVIYVSSDSSDASERRVLVYLPSGRSADTIFTAREDQFGGIRFCGVATDSASRLYIGHNAGINIEKYRPFPTSPAYADRLKPGLWLRADNPTVQTWPATATMFSLDPGSGGGFSTSCRFASSSQGDLYFSYFSVGEAYEPTPVRRAFGTFFDYLPGPPLVTVDSGSTAFAADISSDDVYFNHGDEVVRRDASGQVLEAFGAGQVADSYGLAVNSATGSVYTSNAVEGEISIFEAAVTPDVTSEASVGQTSAVITGEVDGAGGGPVVDCAIEYGTTTEYTETPVKCSPDASTTPYLGTEDITVSLSGLAKETAYHYRMMATNANGTTVGPDRVFATQNVADLTTDAPTEVTQATATLNGSFMGNGEPTSYYFEWGADSSYGNQTATFPGVPASPLDGPVTVSAPISGLSVYLPESEPYRYRVVATNASGTSYGPDRAFHAAPPDLPQVTDSEVSNLTPSSATLESLVNPGGGETLYSFEYGTDPSYGSGTPATEPLEGDFDAHPVSHQLTGLSPATTYHFRVVATNFGGVEYGADRAFTTPAAPGVLGSSASAIGLTSAHLAAEVLANASPTDVRFEYGTTGAYGGSAAIGAIEPDLLVHEVGHDLGGLAPGTTYHYRVVASNSIGSVSGPDRTFTTQAEPVAPLTKVECRKGFVARNGICVRRCRKGSVLRAGRCVKPRKQTTGRKRQGAGRNG